MNLGHCRSLSESLEPHDTLRTRYRRVVIIAWLLVLTPYSHAADELPTNVQVVLDATQPTQHPRNGRLPLYVLPISGQLRGTSAAISLDILQQLDRRAIGYTVEWQPTEFAESLREGLRIAKLQRSIGQPVAVNANACLYSFFDGSPDTLHVSAEGDRFADTSSGGKLGCPFALEHRVPVIKQRVEMFLKAYQQAGVDIDMIFADWEIDGPIEWNDAWKAHKRCSQCRTKIPHIDDFRVFQKTLRRIRSEIQREAFGDNVTNYFPNCLVGNYATYPHDGRRYWYDYFETQPNDGIPVVVDQRAKYREWVHEFDQTGYTFAMPVVYTWYPIFHWYEFDNRDYRWIYNMLKVGSNAGQHTPTNVPIISFVHWHTTAPPPKTDPTVTQLSQYAYQELLWHLLLRGHDTFFLWCMSNELAEEVSLVHQVYAESLRHNGFLQRGTSVSFEVPQTPGSVVSGMQLGNRVLARRTDFGRNTRAPVKLRLNDDRTIHVLAQAGNQIVDIQTREAPRGSIRRGNETLFPIGFYEMPADNKQLQTLANVGVNLVRTADRTALDRAHAVGLAGWMPLDFQNGPTESFRKRVEQVVDHPALAAWEGPDEIVWTITAYSFLKDRAGFTRDDWNAQKPIAVDYSEAAAAKIMPAMRSAVELIRRLDPHHRPVWINEAVDSDVRLARQYMPFIDITGADYYAVRKTGTDLPSIGRAVQRWQQIGGNKPVWMVLQGFSWHTIRPDRDKLYPTFSDSRFMAYDAIVHGAKGIFYWGTNTIDEPRFRTSLYALTSELAAIQPFLTGQIVDGVEVRLIHDLFDEQALDVRPLLLRHQDDFLLILVNEDDHHRLGVDVWGLDAIDGRELHELYGNRRSKVVNGNIVTRMQPQEIQLFSTRKSAYESSWQMGRDFVE